MIAQDFGLKISASELANLLPMEFESELARTNHFANLAWSVFCEPGDGFAGMLVKSLGAIRALQLELQGANANLVLKEILESPTADVDSLFLRENFEQYLMESRERWAPRKSLKLVTHSIRSANELGATTLTRASNCWPDGLSDLESFEPMALWVRGSVKALDRLNDSISVVGCRGCTSYGEFATTQLVSELVANNFSIASGGAYGIDGIAHRAALAMGGNTIAVMAGGVDYLYPTGNRAMLEQVIRQGAVISELPPGTAPTKWRFLNRNRLIAALSRATVIIEANWRSGALNTCNHADKLGREVYALPGPITSPQSAGTNSLIANNPNVQLIVDAKHLIENLGGPAAPSAAQLASLGALETRALDAIGFGECEVNDICLTAGLTSSEAKIALGSLELEGLVVRQNGRWRRTQTTV